MSRIHSDPARELKIYGHYDVVVCGGGPAGFCAAIAAARAGARTLVVEQCNCLGGIATAGGHNHLCLYTSWGHGERVVGGVPFEMVERVNALGCGVWRGGDADFELDAMKLVLERMAREAGVELLYHTLFADAIVEDGRMTGVIIQNKSGRQAVYAKMIVDCTGDADVAASAGAPWEMGRDGDNAVQPCTLMFTIGGVDWPTVQAFIKAEGDWQLKAVWARAQAAGDMRPFQKTVMGFWWTPTRPDQVGVNFTHIVGCDPTSARSITDATVEAREQAFETLAVFRKYVDGMQKAYMVSTAALLGTRESRRIVGEHVLNDKEIVAETPWDDSICYGSFFIDVHNCTGAGMDEETFYPPKGFRYQIPFRTIVPLEIDNLLVAGRCISVTHRALGSTRVMPQCAALGEAAGAAAALAARGNCTPRTLDVKSLQQHLVRAGVILDQAGIDAVNPAAAD